MEPRHPWITQGFSNEQEWRDNLWYLEAECGVPFYSKYGYYSYEAMIEAKAGAMGYPGKELTSMSEEQWVENAIDHGYGTPEDCDDYPDERSPWEPSEAQRKQPELTAFRNGWPMPKPPPYPADDEDDIVPESN